MNFVYNELTIIIVLFEEKKDLLFKCLENIRNFKILIIDNAGNSQLKLDVEKKFNIEKYILNKKNIGFTKAANQAIKLCETDFILNINADGKHNIYIYVSHYLSIVCILAANYTYMISATFHWKYGSMIRKRNID